MVTYAKRPGQADRLGQPEQKRHKMPTAPASGAMSTGGVLIGTTFSPSGAMVPAIRLKRAAHSTGSGGKSSERQAVSNTSGTVEPYIETSTMSPRGHTTVSAPERSSSAESYTLNTHRRRLNAFDGFNLRGRWNCPPTDEQFSGPVKAAIYALSVVITWGACIGLAAGGVYFLAWVTP